MLLKKQEILWLFDVERNMPIEKKTPEDGEHLFFKALDNRLRLTLKLFMVQQSCS